MLNIIYITRRDHISRDCLSYTALIWTPRATPPNNHPKPNPNQPGPTTQPSFTYQQIKTNHNTNKNVTDGRTNELT